jgi:hypothetical protein
MAKKSKKSNEDLASENDFLKLKMMAEFGGDFMASGDLPPEVENQFLKEIGKFHKMHEQAKMITIYDLIDRPEYNHVHDLSPSEVTKELKKLRKKLDKKGIQVESITADLPDKEMYRFITEEVFKHEILDIQMPNWEYAAHL